MGTVEDKVLCSAGTINATNATVKCGLSLYSEEGCWLRSVIGPFRPDLSFAP